MQFSGDIYEGLRVTGGRDAAETVAMQTRESETPFVTRRYPVIGENLHKKNPAIDPSKDGPQPRAHGVWLPLRAGRLPVR